MLFRKSCSFFNFGSSIYENKPNDLTTLNEFLEDRYLENCLLKTTTELLRKKAYILNAYILKISLRLTSASPLRNLDTFAVSTAFSISIITPRLITKCQERVIKQQNNQSL